MQGIYNSVLETNHIYREHVVAAILCLQIKPYVKLFRKLNDLNFYISTLRSICAVPSVVVLYQHPPQYVCSAQCGSFLRSLDFVLSRSVFQGFSEWF
jgi:hypothetical protein